MLPTLIVKRLDLTITNLNATKILSRSFHMPIHSIAWEYGAPSQTLLLCTTWTCNSCKYGNYLTIPWAENSVWFVLKRTWKRGRFGNKDQHHNSALSSTDHFYQCSTLAVSYIHQQKLQNELFFSVCMCACTHVATQTLPVNNLGYDRIPSA